MYHKIETQTLQAIIDYLIKKPFGEVNQLLRLLARAEKLEQENEGALQEKNDTQDQLSGD